jgi:hypothetical protein
MKGTFIFLGLISLLASCTVMQKDSHQNKMNYPTLTKETEIFDTSNFGKHTDRITIVGRDTIYHHYDLQSYSENNSKGNNLKYFSRALGGNGTISGYDYSVNPILGVYKEFFPGGNIKIKGVFCWYGFKTGRWFYFNEKGVLKNVIDYDLTYKFNTDSIMDFCNRKKIPLEKKSFGYRTSIYKKLLDGKYIWIINYPHLDKSYYTTLQLDAKNGKVIKTGQMPFPEDE